jgi:hypothetical protein
MDSCARGCRRHKCIIPSLHHHPRGISPTRKGWRALFAACCKSSPTTTRTTTTTTSMSVELLKGMSCVIERLRRLRTFTDCLSMYHLDLRGQLQRENQRLSMHTLPFVSSWPCAVEEWYLLCLNKPTTAAPSRRNHRRTRLQSCGLFLDAELLGDATWCE